METGRDNSRKNSWTAIIALCCAGLLINIAGAKLALALHLPLFLDSIGTILSAVLGGFIPGIIVGFLSNIINSIWAFENIYYGSLNVLIAVFSTVFAIRGYFGKWQKIPVIIVTFALIGGALGSILTYCMYGLEIGNGISAPLAHSFYDNGTMNLFWAQFSADMLIDLLDKTVTVLIVVAVLRLLPESLRSRLELSGWRQQKISLRSSMNDAEFEHRRSLRLKIILLMSLATIITAVAVTAISYVNFRKASINEQKTLAQGVLDVVVGHVDGDRVDEYIEKGEAAEGYAETKGIMQSLMDSSDYIEFVYVYRILEDGCHVVFDPDTEDTPGAKPGEVIGFDTAFEKYLPALLAGEEIPEVESDETYGWLLTLYRPVKDSSGVTQCYAAVDINMNHINVDGYRFLAKVLALFLGFFIIIMTVALWLAEYNVIQPINSMAVTANRFAFNTEEARIEALGSIRYLGIHTDDEIENLYDAMVKTTEDMLANIAEMQNQNEKISKLQNGLILVLADMVESRDQNTGDHVRKTAAYVAIIMRELRKEHIYEDQLTDEFMADVINSAPLHDVGKIHVPDAILNKPGKLTDEEFEQMKEHTTAGRDIITQAMNTVSDANSTYLAEARNLAHYHHEKWNGKGYPDGLQGTDIPLSARIMAVADVFDALVSRRSYKEPFTFEKAMDIIREGGGTHFDPNVAEAFIRAGDEVRTIMNTYMG